MGRNFRLQSYNAYRRRFRLEPIKSYAELNWDRALQASLKALYPNIDDMELVVGLFAEQADDGLLFGDLLNHMVAYDAFTQIYTNPLLSPEVFNVDTFTQDGLDCINATGSIQALVDRNAHGARASLGYV